MIVCHCAVVSDHEISQAIDAGAGSLAAVCRATGAGRDCGSCVLSLKSQLCKHQASLIAAPMEIEYAAS